MLVQKHRFRLPRFHVEARESLPVAVGYETYGQLNATCDNAILICHHFSGNSHVAGRYHADDALPGWWDPLVGPGKAFDTNRYFVIGVDSLCNVNVRDPNVITTGPATLHPETDRPYGNAFPQVTIRDNVRLQRELLRSLGIEKLACVAGPSMGGFQALEWAVTYPEMVRRVIGAITSHRALPIFALAACHLGTEMIETDPAYLGGSYYGGEGPIRGVSQAVLLLTTLTRSDRWVDAMWGSQPAAGSPDPRTHRTGHYAFQAEMERIARDRALHYDANHFRYLARGAMLHDITYGTPGLEAAAATIQAEVLMLPIVSDLLCPPAASEELVAAIRAQGGRARCIPIETPNGHLAGIFEAKLMAEPIADFLAGHTFA